MANKNIVPKKLIQRNLKKEKIIGITDLNIYAFFYEKRMEIIGEIYGDIRAPFVFRCSVYDQDDDIIATGENRSIGSGLVSNYIIPACFFEGYPFMIDLEIFDSKKIKKIVIEPDERK